MAVNLHFFLLRLRHSSPPELAWRLRQTITRLLLSFFEIFGRELPDVPAISSDAITDLILPDFYSTEITNCDRDGAWVTAETSIGNDYNNHNAGQIGTTGSPSAMGDIRLIWEPARLQQAMWLLVNAYSYSDLRLWKKTKLVVKKIIMRWITTNPFAQGMHYISAMECALRIPVFYMALKRIDDLRAAEYDLILKTIYRHAWLISKKLSLYASLGNHTITEAVGLVFAGAIYQSTPIGRRWLDTGLKLLDDELTHQILDDGGPAEQSLNYHRLVLDLYWLTMDFIKKNNLADELHWQPRLAAGESFLCAFQDGEGCFPSIGDSDDGYAIAPGISPARTTETAVCEKRLTFRESGYTVIRNDQLVFTFDHGSLGMAPFYNHGHADALAITLSKNGHPILVDPGTYRYNGVPRWRAYFKGTRAHNTVTIDDQDQAVQKTSFIWSQPYDAGLTTYREKNGDLFCHAVHDGYTRLKAPVRHHRSVCNIDRDNFLIKDRFTGTGIHCFQINYHLHPRAIVAMEGRWWVIDHGGERVFMRLVEGDFQVVRGQDNPLMGWYSHRYGQKEPTCTLTFTQTGAVDRVVFTTAICTRLTLGGDHMNIKVGELEGTIKNT